MENYLEKAKPIHTVINTAWQAGFVAETLAGLTDLAVLMMEAGKTPAAANILAYILHHPDVPYDTFDRAEDLFIDLEAHLGQQVIEDAKEQARYLTMRGVVEAALAVE
ncbi:MAG TPA: hypothetical protein VHL11_15580 [Phototrophicaceae bacterium]|jgi:hypothetical protein|nr:hypothetical protein [Phototrophicaceae bacterium]